MINLRCRKCGHEQQGSDDVAMCPACHLLMEAVGLIGGDAYDTPREIPDSVENWLANNKEHS